MPASAAVAWELARAVGGVVLLPLRVLRYWGGRARLRRLVLEDLQQPARVSPLPAPAPAPERPLCIFVSCAEPSGEIHASTLVAELGRAVLERGGAAPRFLGLGGERLRRAGVHTVGDPVRRATIGFEGVFRALPFYLGLLRDAVTALDEARPDVLVAVDSPALHVPLGRIARRRGVPVVHFVTPQYWGWAPWRTAGYRSAVDLALTILPFEPRWFARARIPTAHVGHPLLDALPQADPADPRTAGRGTEPLLALLPGSRAGVVDQNLPWMLDVVAELKRRRPELEVVLPHGREEMRGQLEGHLERAGSPPWVRVEVGDLHASLARATAAFSVSGTVLIDLLHERLPTVVVYRVANARETWLYRNVLVVPWFSSPNLLAAREVLPEFCFHGEGPRDAVADALERSLWDEDWRHGCRRGLDEAARRLGPPGAAARAAAHSLSVALAAAS